MLPCDVIKQKMKTKNIDICSKDIWKKFPSAIISQNVINRFKILLKIFELYNQMGLKDKAEIKLNLDEKILPK